MDTHEYFSSIHIISNEDYGMLAQHFRKKRFKKGEHAVTQGSIQKDLFLVEEGVMMYCFEVDRASNVLGFAYPPNAAAIPEAFSLQKPSSYYLTCLTDCEVSCISFQALQAMYDRSQQIERLFRKLAETVAVGLIARQIELRSTTMEERFTRFCNRSPHLLQKVPHKYIAAYLDISPTNFSKLYNSKRI